MSNGDPFRVVAGSSTSKVYRKELEGPHSGAVPFWVLNKQVSDYLRKVEHSNWFNSIERTVKLSSR